MARPVNQQRRTELLDGAVDYVITHGLGGLSLRPLAAALGTDAPVLLHHFGSKDQLIALLLNGVRDRLRAIHQLGAQETDKSPEAQLQRVWTWAASPDRDSLFRLFFEAYGLALANPDRYRSFLDHVIQDWLNQLIPAFAAAGFPADRAESQATLAVATIRGLLLDLLTTGDRQRIETALQELDTCSAWPRGRGKVS